VNNLIVNGVSAGYGSIRVLDGVSIALEEGKTVVLLGTNGNGKSTLLKCITGFVRPASGSIILEANGKSIDLVGKAPEEIANLGISMVPEGRRLFPVLTVEENLTLGSYRKAARKDLAKNKEFCFQAFPILRERQRQMAGTLSGGEQQMLTIARALMSNPRILLIDEASQGLAPVIISELMRKIQELKEQKGLTVLMTEQNFNQAIKIADKGYIMVHGKIKLECASNKELRESSFIKSYYLGIDVA
jgi:branched-chain amino acid transport system ATP-binding protein